MMRKLQEICLQNIKLQMAHYQGSSFVEYCLGKTTYKKKKKKKHLKL